MSTDIQQAFTQALAHYHAGRMREVEQICRQVLEYDPRVAAAWNLLGIVSFGEAQYETSLQYFGNACDLSPGEADFFSNQGLAHQALGRYESALPCYRQSLHYNPSSVVAHYNLGNCLHALKLYAEAAASYLRALALDPQLVAAHNNLGNSYLAQGLVAEAAASLRRALTLAPDFAAAHNNLGMALLREARFVEAATHFQRALELDPNMAEAFNNLGTVRRQQRDFTQAVDLINRAIELRPRYAEAYNNLGSALLMLNEHDAAIASFQDALQIEPYSAEIHDLLGNALRVAERLDEAAPYFDRALQLNPLLASAHANLGATWHARGFLEEAIACYRRAIVLDQRSCFAHTNLAQALVAVGQCDEALAILAQAIEVEPHNALAHWVLASNSPRPLNTQTVETLEQLLTGDGPPAEDRWLLHFALAHSYDKCVNYDRALMHAHCANELKRRHWQERGQAFNRAAHIARIDELIAFYSPEFFAAAQSLGTDSELPVFVVGMPRSGTTLVEQILASHSQVFGAGELDDLHNLQPTAQEFLRGGLNRSLRWTDDETASVREIADGYLQSLARLGGPARRVVDKMPTNFLHLGLIATLFPQARVIHCVRDPRDVLLSCYFQNFSSEAMNFTFDWGDLTLYLEQYQRLMDHWRAVLPLTIHEVAYEQLVRDQERVTRDLVAHVGLPWEPRCLEFHKTVRTVSTASAVQVRAPLYTQSVARWCHYEPHFQSLPPVHNMAR